MDLGLSGRRALVAAASTGLGFAIAMELAREGCQVAICSRDRERIEGAATAIAEATGAALHPLVCDVTSDASIAAMVTDTVGLMGGIDLLVPNAGGPPYGTFADLTAEQWEQGYRLTLASAVSFARHTVPTSAPDRRWCS